MPEEQNGTLYINNAPSKEGFFETSTTIDGDYLIADNVVIAGPTTFTGTVTVTGNLVEV